MDKLVETNSFFFNDGNEPSYNLFFSKTNVYPIVKYEKQLQQINDYCYMTMKSFEYKIDELGHFASNLSDMQYEFEEFTIGSWKDLSDDISRCTLLMLLLSYLESSLHEIAKWFCDKKSVIFIEHSKTNNIKHFLEIIGRCCGNDIIVALPYEMNILNGAISVRNKFVHKPWDSQFNRDKMFDLCKIINTLAEIFATVETRAIAACILKESS